MLEPRRGVLLDILDLERRLLDVYMELLAEHDSSRRRPQGQEQPSTATPRTVRADVGYGYLRAITMPAARDAWPTFVTLKWRQISAHTSDQMYVTAILSASLAASALRRSVAPRGNDIIRHPIPGELRIGENICDVPELSYGRFKILQTHGIVTDTSVRRF